MAGNDNHSDSALNSATDKDTLVMLSGVALMIFGAGLILSNPLVRRYLGQLGIGSFGADCLARPGSLPEIEVYVVPDVFCPANSSAPGSVRFADRRSKV